MPISSNTAFFNTKDATEYFDPLVDINVKPHYLFAARSTPWSNDQAVPNIETNPGFIDYQIYDEMVFGKLIDATNISPMIRRIVWTYGTVYDRYDNTDSNLSSKNFYAAYDEAGATDVFKCLDNNNGIPSIYPPKLSETSLGDSQYYTADGYHWKYIYTVDSSTMLKFATPDYMPVVANSEIAAAAVPGSIDAIILSSGGASYFSSANGNFKQVAVGGNTQIFAIDPTSTSSNNNFYVGSSLYIKSGAAGGQLRDIISYQISGNTHLLGVNTAFDTLPDLTSNYQIAPKVSIIGDGVGAQAISIINPTTNAVDAIRIINEGYGYTEATVSVSGNTGGLTVANSAIAIATIPPRGGHGSNPIGEFSGNHLGISVAYLATDTLPKTGSYRRIGILASPTYSDVVVQFTNAASSFIVGEDVVQEKENTLQLSVYNSDQYQYSNQYDVSKYSILQFTAPVSFANDEMVQNSSGNTTGIIINSISNNSFLVRRDPSVPQWANGSLILLSSNAAVNGTISSISQGFADGKLYGRDDANTIFSYSSASDTLRVFVGNTSINSADRAAPTDPQFTVNAASLTISNFTLSNTSVVSIDRYSSNSSQQTLSSNTNLFIKGTITQANATALVLDNVSGRFNANGTISGLSSTVTANIVSIAGQDITFDQRTQVKGSYSVGSAQFAASNTVYQFDTANNVTASAIIHEIENAGNVYTFSLTNVKGSIAVSTNSTSKYIQSASGDKKLIVNTVTAPNINPYTGEIRYVENSLPVQRSNTQSETIRFVLTYY